MDSDRGNLKDSLGRLLISSLSAADADTYADFIPHSQFSGLYELLDGSTGPYTIFAPDNAGFEKSLSPFNVTWEDFTHGDKEEAEHARMVRRLPEKGGEGCLCRFEWHRVSAHRLDLERRTVLGRRGPPECFALQS